MPSKKKVNLKNVFFLSIISFLLGTNIAYATTTTLPSFGNETVETINLVTDGIKNFLLSFAGPYWLVVIIGFFALIVVALFAMMMRTMGSCIY